MDRATEYHFDHRPTEVQRELCLDRELRADGCRTLLGSSLDTRQPRRLTTQDSRIFGFQHRSITFRKARY